MGAYATDHASALRDVTQAGGDCPFTRTSPGTFDATTNTFSSPAETTIAGKAVELEGRPDVYRDLSLVQSNPATLFWVPSTYGSVPKPGDANTWAGVTRTVKQVQPLAPDGTVIAATIVVAV